MQLAINTTFGDRSGNHLDVIAEELDLRTKRKNEKDILKAIYRIIDNKEKEIALKWNELNTYLETIILKLND